MVDKPNFELKGYLIAIYLFLSSHIFLVQSDIFEDYWKHDSDGAWCRNESLFALVQRYRWKEDESKKMLSGIIARLISYTKT